MSTSRHTQEESLDPTDWSALQALGYQMLDDIFHYLETVRERPVWQPVPEEVRSLFQTSLPLEEQPAEKVYEEFFKYILPYPLGNTHPRFWGAVIGTGTPLAMLADMLAAGMNSLPSLGDSAPVWVERQVIDWFKEMLDFPPESSGILVSGTTVANLTALAVARHTKAGFDVHKAGVVSAERPMTIYGSLEMHASLDRAVEVLGLGTQYLRRVAVNDHDQIDLNALRQTISDDLQAGLQPICIIGNAGTTNTGAIDPLNELADIAGEYGLWFHIDGAFGALAYLSPRMRSTLAGMERADSLAFDLHKWPYLPYDIGCVLIRDEEAHHRTFTIHMDYIDSSRRGWNSGPPWYIDYGIQVSRGFRALKVWMAFKTYGVNKLGRLIEQNINQAHYLAELIEEAPQLELLAPVALNVVCFRFVKSDWSNERLDSLNEEILLQLQESGVAVPTDTFVKGRYSIRCAITNHRSRREDFEILISDIIRIGETLVAENWGSTQ